MPGASGLFGEKKQKNTKQQKILCVCVCVWGGTGQRRPPGRGYLEDTYTRILADLHGLAHYMKAAIKDAG